MNPKQTFLLATRLVVMEAPSGRERKKESLKKMGKHNKSHLSPSLSAEDQAKGIELEKSQSRGWSKMHAEAKQHVQNMFKDFDLFLVRAKTEQEPALRVQVFQKRIENLDHEARTSKKSLERIGEGRTAEAEVILWIPLQAKLEIHILKEEKMFLVASHSYRYNNFAVHNLSPDKGITTIQKNEIAGYFEQNIEKYDSQFLQISWTGSNRNLLLDCVFDFPEEQFYAILDKYQTRR